MASSDRRAGMPKRTPLTIRESKLDPPRTRDGTIPRAELVDRLRFTPPANVTLLVAPAGYGKTTVLTELFRRVGKRPVAWLAVDEHDNDPVTFLTYLAVALNRIGVCDGRVAEVLARPRSSLSTIVARLRRCLDAAGSFGLFLDDVHLLTSERSVDVLRALVDDLPSGARIVLASRTEPALSLAGLRARGRLAEFGIDDLRLSEDETALLLRTTGVEASDEDVAALTARTEGWPAGIYLAALATLARHDERPVTAFSGSDRFVGDYVRAEHLASLPAGDVDFMVGASVLDRMSGPLCDAVLERSGSAATLEQLAQSNLFLIPLGGDEPREYRFQILFREALQAELRDREPGRAGELAARASEWCEANDDVQGAVEYAWAAGNQERFATLLGQFSLALYSGGRMATIERWYALLDDATLEKHPELAAIGAFLHGLEGRDEQARRWAAVAERAPVTAMPDGSPVTAWTALLRAAMCRSGVEQMLVDAELASASLAEGSPWRPASFLVLGVANRLLGGSAAADRLLGEAYSAATAADASGTAALALAERSLLAASEDRWQAAETFAVEAREALHDARLEDYVTSAMAYAASARSAVVHNDWVRARHDLERVEHLLPALTQAFPWFTVQVLLETASVRLGLSDPEGAAAVHSQAEAVLERSADLGILRARADVLAAELAARARPSSEGGEHLTPAELRLLPLLTTHLTFREIAEHLNVSRNTVKTQAICTYRKLGATSRSEAIQRATELGLVETPEVLETAGRG